MCGSLGPKIERLLILKSPKDGEVIFSVSPNRYFSKCSEGISLEVCDAGYSLLGYNCLPILLQFKGFDSGEKRFRELHERLARMDFDPIKREFPFVPTQLDINFNKFDNLIHQHAEEGEYIKSYGGRSTIEEALRKGIMTFEEAERFLPGLLNGEIVFESQVIKDLCSKLREN